MAANTALCFLLVTAALALLDVRSRSQGWLSATLAVGAAMLAFIALVGYLSGDSSLYARSEFTQMSVPTALAFIVVAAAIACARPDLGPIQLVLSDTVGGEVVRLLFLVNAAVLIAFSVAQTLAPAAVSFPVHIAELAVLATGASALVVLNLVVLRHAFAPLERLSGAMGRIDLRRQGQEIPVYGLNSQVVQLTEAFNAMLKRLERERRESARKILAAQEDERARIARELHDEVGQGLTAALLHLKRASRETNEGWKSELEWAIEVVRESLEETREIASRLRPEALDDLGLRSALLALTARVSNGARIAIDAELPAPIPALDPDRELVVYRIAQEALTNVARHANATRASLSIVRADGMLLLGVEDDGCGFGDDAVPGAGLEGMRERALLVSGTLKIGASERGGTAVHLALPLADEQQ